MSLDPVAELFRAALSRLREGDAAGAAVACREALDVAPRNPDLLALLGACLVALREPAEALGHLDSALELAPSHARAWEERGRALLQLRRIDEAVLSLQRAMALEPGSALTRRLLAQALLAQGKGAEADALLQQDFSEEPHRQVLLEAAAHQRAGRFRESEALLRSALEASPRDVDALRMLARVAEEAERPGEAERLLRRVISLAPDFDDARLDLARVLKQRDKVEQAVECTGEVVSRSPRNPLAQYLHASMLALTRRYDEAIAAYRESIRLRPDNPAAWVGLAHLLKTLGRQQEGVDAYREALRLRPDFGEVYWSLANLKTFRFTAEEIAMMERCIADTAIDEDALVHFCFALAKSREDAGAHAEAFSLYERANVTQRMRVAYDPVDSETQHERIRVVFTAELLRERAAPVREDEPVPIFIVGLPRSGSTLLEQILASHPLVEGTAELPDIGRAITEITRRHPEQRYPHALARISDAELAGLGRDYLDRTRRHRSGKPFFTDKMPNNFASVGLIRLILPQARIIDARRHPLDSCLGCFRQHFAQGQSFTYDLEELADFYLEYRRMMTHWEAALPGAVLELRYEDMVRSQEAETRRLLAFCGLPWDERCLRFHETERAVRTASSEQVRMPLYDSALGRWRNYRAQLSPLIEILEPELRREGWEL